MLKKLSVSGITPILIYGKLSPHLVFKGAICKKFWGLKTCAATWANKLTEATVKNRIQLAVSFSSDVLPLFVWGMSLILNI